ncbi:DUF2510 domain-containing protein [Actinomadura sp. NEAU-AAG7]|uniref:DUF2510 domain-containing protein n=1 Tax=Actinomadura sp. NEAU-AAG7 TaxID=2839640 RepID=UPI001BE472B5|nr:DUF2510 domain-containing protein [Actinomadura sp. NEAU-AAG7]MBT2211115.1 DUF2510 domain-containing protein [Actinomadura sp. NEAU-AAG7]
MSAEPGWYPDPHWMGRERYWDGDVWTDQSRPYEGKPARAHRPASNPPPAPLDPLPSPGPAARRSPPKTADLPRPPRPTAPRLPPDGETTSNARTGDAPADNAPADADPPDDGPAGDGPADEAPAEAAPSPPDLVKAAPRPAPTPQRGAAIGLPVVLGVEAVAVAPAAYALHLLWPLWGPAALVGGWVLVTLLALAPSTARHVYGHRAAAESEAALIAEAWRDVRHRLGLDPRTYRLLVTDSGELTACAPAGRVITVTSHSASALSAEQLAGVLAHEVGHAFGARLLPVFVHAQLALPNRAAQWVLRALWSPVGPMWRRAVGWHRPAGFLPVLLFAAFACAGSLLVAVPAAAASAAALVARLFSAPSDGRADAVAIRAGLGPDLLSAMERTLQEASERGEVPVRLARRTHRLRHRLS